MSQAIGALIFVLAILVLFAVGFGAFLFLPFFLFIGGIIAMVVSDRNHSSGPAPETVSDHDEPQQGGAA